jgi:hypothetical protein
MKHNRTVARTLPAAMLVLFHAAACLAGDPAPPPPQDSLFPHQEIQRAEDMVGELLEQGALSKQIHDQLDQSLRRARLSLFEAEPQEALDGLSDFLDEASQYIEKGLLAPNPGGILLQFGLSAMEAIRADLAPMELPIWPEFCQAEPPPPANIPVLHVSANAMKEGDGSVARPFRTITAALARAQIANMGAVDLRVAPGRYEEHLQITRHTRILGTDAPLLITTLAGSIENRGPWSLEVRHLAIVDSGSGPPGALFVRHPCASTILERVSILHPVGFGISQRGGRFTAQALFVDNTWPASPTVGAAIFLDGGVEAGLRGVHISRSHGGGLVIKDPETRASASMLEITDTEANPFAVDGDISNPGLASLEIRDGARFLGRFVTVDRNELAGVLVYNGAICDLTYARISNTRSYSVDAFVRLGGINLTVFNATCRMSGFTISDGELCGVNLGMPLETPPVSVDLFDGFIVRHAIGANVQVEGYDPVRLRRATVVYADNDIDIQIGSFPLPAFPPVEP